MKADRLVWVGQIAGKVKLFFFEYARNRHKMTTITPSYHAVRLFARLSLPPRLAPTAPRTAR